MEAETIHGAAILLLDLPPAALAGIDLLSFTTTPRFKGIKNLPPGLHMVFTSSTSSLSIRHGTWFRVAEHQETDIQLFVKQWDALKEELLPVRDQADVLRHRANLGSIWRESLTPYRQNATDETPKAENDDWRKLTSCISDTLLARITGEREDNWSLTSASSAPGDQDDIPGLSEETSYQREMSLNFLPIDLKRTWPAGATGRERTQAARDHSWALLDIIEHHCNGDEEEILGEFQFCFLMILTLNNYSCMEQWKRLMTLLFTSTAAISKLPHLYIEALRCLTLQLQHSQDVDGGLFDLSDNGAGQLKNILRRFKKSLDDIEGKVKSDITDELDELESLVRKDYGWDLDDNFVRRGMVTLEDGERVEVTMPGYDEEDESGEYAPTVVELSADQMKELTGQSSIGNSGLDVSEEDLDAEDLDQRY